MARFPGHRILNKKKDNIFDQQITDITDFSFDKQTAAVFDDMVERSVPQYHEIQRMIGELAADFAVQDTKLFDLGCSTGTTLSYLDPVVDAGVAFVGIDNSMDMIIRAQEKLASSKVHRDRQFVVADLHQDCEISNASVVIMNLTLQFIRPLQRERVIKTIFDGLLDQGALILVEKLNLNDGLFNRLFIRYYYDMKRRQGYSDIEIAQKREALENVLIPYRPEENIALLENAGFKHTEEFFRWYNFSGVIAVK